MVIEYAGELIRSTLTDKRERYYDGRGIGCYMFKIDENSVVDATMRGNAARFINHSCEVSELSLAPDMPHSTFISSFSRVLDVPSHHPNEQSTLNLCTLSTCFSSSSSLPISYLIHPQPNCYSKVVDILGHKHIIIFALRRIVQGEELTYDYKFPFEDVKIPCSCGSKKCRKYLN